MWTNEEAEFYRMVHRARESCGGAWSRASLKQVDWQIKEVWEYLMKPIEKIKNRTKFLIILNNARNILKYEKELKARIQADTLLCEILNEMETYK
jgi:3-methyladenine DNA glycosylase Tag